MEFSALSAKTDSTTKILICRDFAWEMTSLSCNNLPMAIKNNLLFYIINYLYRLIAEIGCWLHISIKSFNAIFCTDFIFFLTKYSSAQCVELAWIAVFFRRIIYFGQLIPIILTKFYYCSHTWVMYLWVM